MNKEKPMKPKYAEKFLQFLNEEEPSGGFSKKDERKIEKDWNEFSAIISEKGTIEEVPERYREFAKMYIEQEEVNSQEQEIMDTEQPTEEIVNDLMAELEEDNSESQATPDIVDSILSKEVEEKTEDLEDPKTLVEELQDQLSEIKTKKKPRKRTQKKSPMDDYETVQGQKYGDISSLTRQARFEQGILPWNFSGAAAWFWEEMDRIAQDNPGITDPEEIKQIAVPAFIQKVEEGGYNCTPRGRVKTLYPYWRRYSNLSPVKGQNVTSRGKRKKKTAEDEEEKIEDLTEAVETVV